jgi:hypothetical protein
MAQIIYEGKELDEFLKSYNVITDNRIILKYDNYIYIVSPGDYVYYDGYYLPYAGLVNNVKELNKCSCIYKIGNRIMKQTVTPKKNDVSILLKKKLKTRDESRLLNTTINSNDTELLVMVKRLLNGWTLNEFKSLFKGPNSHSRYSNVKREIEEGHSITFVRFTELLDLVNCRYRIQLFMDNDKQISSDEVTNGVKTIDT